MEYIKPGSKLISFYYNLDGQDINQWEMDELKNIVNDFIAL